VTARNQDLGKKAVDDLQQKAPGAKIDFCQMDITDAASAASCAEYLKGKYGKVDILVNNAGFAYKGSAFGAKEAATTLRVNLTGTRTATEAILPLMKEPGRIVNLCSRYSHPSTAQHPCWM
jgi:short-subunit dehydrogenase